MMKLSEKGNSVALSIWDKTIGPTLEAMIKTLKEMTDWAIHQPEEERNLVWTEEMKGKQAKKDDELRQKENQEKLWNRKLEEEQKDFKGSHKWLWQKQSTVPKNVHLNVSSASASDDLPQKQNETVSNMSDIRVYEDKGSWDYTGRMLLGNFTSF